MLALDRVLNLSKEEDRKELIAAAADDGRLRSLLKENLSDYCSYFAGEEWQRVHSGGVVNVRISEKAHTGYQIDELLELVCAINRLKKYNGFPTVLSGLKNPTQIDSTIFELRVADWCRSRQVSEGLTFVPDVVVAGRVKRPEFLWHTKLGNCYCECKKSNFLHNAFHARLSRMTQLLDQFFKRYEKWDTALRLDVTFGRGTTNCLHREFKWVIDRAQQALKDPDPLGAAIYATQVSACFRPRTQDPSEAPDTMRQYLATVGTVATELKSASYLSLTMNLASYRAETTARLVRDARSQLPRNTQGLIFIEGLGRVAAMQKLKTLLTAATYEYTPWVSLWMHGACMGAVWRDGQPLDRTLLV